MATNPTDCSGGGAPATPQTLHDSAETVKCAKPRCPHPARRGFTRCASCAEYARRYKHDQRAALRLIPGPRTWRECGAADCRQLFETTGRRVLQKWCSARCSSRAAKRRQRPARRGPRYIRCAWCGTRAVAHTSRKKWCGPNCGQSAYQARVRAQREEAAA